MDPLTRLTQLLTNRLSEKSWKKHLNLIAHQILGVDGGIKFGFLFDCGFIETKRLIDLIKEIKSFGLIRNDIIIVQIGVDVIIFNLNNFLENVKIPLCINISKSLQKPEILDILDSVVKMFKYINTQLEEFSDRSNNDLVLELKLDCTFCIPTIFGYLIGYPVLYWYDVFESDDNCLGDVDLQVYQILCHRHLIYSFSIPSILSDDPLIKLTLRKWRLNMVSFDITNKEFVANFPVVIL